MLTQEVMDLSIFDNITEENYIRYAMKCYDNPCCQSVEEFFNDLNNIKYIKRLLNRYHKTGKISSRLLLNHLITFKNVFGPTATVRIVLFKLDSIYYPVLKTFFVFMNIMPKVIYGINGRNIVSADIQLDMNVVGDLRKI